MKKIFLVLALTTFFSTSIFLMGEQPAFAVRRVHKTPKKSGKHKQNKKKKQGVAHLRPKATAAPRVATQNPQPAPAVASKPATPAPATK